ETSGLLNRRRGITPTEGSNPSVSARPNSASDHHEVTGRQGRAAAERGELHGRAGAIAIGVIEEGAGGGVIDDPVVAIGRRRAGDERPGAERAHWSDPYEHRIVQQDLVRAGDEADNRVDIAGAKGSGELKAVGAAEPSKDIVAALAVEDIGAVIAVDRIGQ